MFHEDYYRIEEAANKLEIKTHTLIKRATEGKVQICVVLPSIVTDYTRKRINNMRYQSHLGLLNRLILGGIDRTEKHSALIDNESKSKGSMVEIKIPLYPLIPYAIPTVSLIELTKYSFSKPDIYHGGTCDQIECPNLQKIDDEGIVDEEYLYSLNGVTITPCNDIVITHTELTRLLALKAEPDGKPTAEQSQQRLDEANARIAELEAAQSNDTKQPIQQQREQALLFWVEGMGRDTVMKMTKPQIHEAMQKIDPIFHFSDFDKFWQKQQVIKLEGGKPTR